MLRPFQQGQMGPHMHGYAEWGRVLQENGSMLLALTAQEGQDLQDRAAMLQQNGISAAYHGRAAVTELEPALQLPHSGGALLVESDAQLVRPPKIISCSKFFKALLANTPLSCKRCLDATVMLSWCCTVCTLSLL